MKLPLPLAWLILLGGFFTAGLLRQFHDRTPVSPWIPPIVGSLLFAGIVLLLLVAAREARAGAVGGSGLRLGSLLPLLLMLLVEKWVSISFYAPLFASVAPSGASDVELDARFRALAGLGLLVVCVLVAPLSRGAARTTRRRAGPRRWPVALVGTLLVCAATYAMLAALAAAFGARFRLVLPIGGALLAWILVGQALLAFAEELYFRGLVLAETERLAPRLGLRSAPGRRWLALGLPAALFGMEHVDVSLAGAAALRQLVFTVALGLLLGILVLVSDNLVYTTGLHAWINWLLLGAAPRLVDEAESPVLPAGTYIGVALILAFVLAFLHARRQRAIPSGGAALA